MLIRHGQAVGRAPVAEIGLAIHRTGASHGLVLLAENVAGLRIDKPAHPGNRATNIDDGNINVADFFGAVRAESECGVVGVLRDVDQFVVKLRQRVGLLFGRHAAAAFAGHVHESGVRRSDDGQRALLGFDFDVNAVGELHVYVDGRRRGARFALIEQNVHGLDRFELGQASHRSGNFFRKRLALGIRCRGLGFFFSSKSTVESS